MKSIFLFVLIPFFSVGQVQNQLHSSNLSVDNTLKVKSYKKYIRNTLILGGYGAVVFLCYRQADNHFREEFQEHKIVVTDVITKAASPLGLGKTNAIALGATTGFAFLTKNKKLKHAVYIWAGTMLINDAVTNKMKGHFQRLRPSTWQPPNSFDWENGNRMNRSFPSAHTSNAFATATVFATIYKDKKWVTPFAYGMATMVGISRMYDNAHWASDVMAGAAIGFISAKTMIELDKLLQKTGIFIYPHWGQGGSLTMVYRF